MGEPTGESASAVLEEELERQTLQLARRVAEGRESLERLRGVMESIESSVADDERLLLRIRGLLPSGRQPSLDSLDERLRGVALRDAALAVLAVRAKPGEAVHYRDWYSWVREAGFTVAGRDPLATFLAQVTRAEGVHRVGGMRSGRYALADR